MTTVAPRSASSVAMARPMPREAPVTRAILVSSGRDRFTSGSMNIAVAIRILLIFVCVHRLEDGRDALAASDAHGHERIFSVDPPQFMQGFHGDDRACRSERMPERNAAAVG